MWNDFLTGVVCSSIKRRVCSLCTCQYTPSQYPQRSKFAPLFYPSQCTQKTHISSSMVQNVDPESLEIDAPRRVARRVSHGRPCACHATAEQREALRGPGTTQGGSLYGAEEVRISGHPNYAFRCHVTVSRTPAQPRALHIQPAAHTRHMAVPVPPTTSTTIQTLRRATRTVHLRCARGRWRVRAQIRYLDVRQSPCVRAHFPHIPQHDTFQALAIS